METTKLSSERNVKNQNQSTQNLLISKMAGRFSKMARSVAAWAENGEVWSDASNDYEAKLETYHDVSMDSISEGELENGNIKSSINRQNFLRSNFLKEKETLSNEFSNEEFFGKNEDFENEKDAIKYGPTGPRKYKAKLKGKFDNFIEIGSFLNLERLLTINLTKSKKVQGNNTIKNRNHSNTS